MTIRKKEKKRKERKEGRKEEGRKGKRKEKRKEKRKTLVRMWRYLIPCASLVGMQSNTAAGETVQQFIKELT